MNKVSLDFPVHIKAAIVFNLFNAGVDVVSNEADADITLSSLNFPDGKIRVGAVVDKVQREVGASFVVGKVKFDIKLQVATMGDVSVKLTEKEAFLIAKLVARDGDVSRAEILQDVWGYADGVDTKTVESHVHRLNQKMDEEFGLKLVHHQGGYYSLTS